MIYVPIIQILVVLILVALALWVLGQLPIDPALYKIIRIVIVVVFALWLIGVLLGGWPHLVRITR